MSTYVSLSINWLLFLALFPMVFFWGRRFYRIYFKKDYSEVALKGGYPPENPQKFAFQCALLNFIAALIIICVILGVISATMDFQTWTAIAGSTLWIKIFLDFAISRHAHFKVKAKVK